MKFYNKNNSEHVREGIFLKKTAIKLLGGSSKESFLYRLSPYFYGFLKKTSKQIFEDQVLNFYIIFIIIW